ncbi:MAG: hypothetical protein BWY11_02003 [Firmicutes bacterium ADurb.Bin182]|nr:MAG: hypothetical protein BWY11_02003 [Firmicutes bacterium ADurb.Bin182]
MSSGMKKALIVAACIAAVGLLLIGISFIVGNRGVFEEYRIPDYSYGANKAVEPYYVNDMELDAFTSVKVDVVNADISIVKSTSYGIEIDYQDSRYNPTYRVGNNTLTVKDDPVRNVRRFWDLFSFNFWRNNGLSLKRGQITVYLPEHEYESIELENVNGGITISDTYVDRLDAECVNSTISMENVKTNRATWTSVNGKIEARELTGSNINIECVNGSIELSGELSGKCRFETVNGTISIDTALERNQYDLDLSTVTGKVFLDGQDHKKGLESDTGAANSLYAETVNGRIEINFGK